MSGLQAETGMVNGEVGVVEGYFAAGDSGGGQLYFDTTKPASATVSAASISGGVLTLTTSGNHGLSTGQCVTIAGVGGITGVNNLSWVITKVSNTQLSLDGWSGSGSYTSGGLVGDGGTAIPASDSSGHWRRLWSSVLDVAWFGAKQDGTTDDTLALLAAITAIQLAGGVRSASAGPRASPFPRG